MLSRSKHSCLLGALASSMKFCEFGLKLILEKNDDPVRIWEEAQPKTGHFSMVSLVTALSVGQAYKAQGIVHITHRHQREID